VPLAAEALVLHEDRYFDPEPSVRAVARELFAEMRALPIVSPHGHVDARLLAEDAPFPEPTSLIVWPDHYILRMLYSRGLSLDALGVPPAGSSTPTADPRAVWQIFAEHYALFHGTPTAAWLDYQLAEVFGIRARLTGASARRVYDEIMEKLASPEFRPRALFDRFNIEVLATTDGAADSLEHHAAIRSSRWKGAERVIPTFRPDALFRIASAEWIGALAALGRACGADVASYDALLRALADRRRFFRSMGATATDHAVVEPYTASLTADEGERLFQRALSGTAAFDDQRRFEGGLLMEMARMSTDDGLVMQLHAGSLRNHNRALFERFGPDRGGDIPIATEFTRNLRPLLDAYGSDRRLILILFTLDESTYSRELGPLAGHYPALRLGPPWWFHDSIEGMTRFREQAMETAGIANTAGFNDDTRAFCSIPARHDLARRVDANWLARLVARHIVSLAAAREMARALTVDLARDAYRLSQPARP
jgi:glucuronate isomerase